MAERNLNYQAGKNIAKRRKALGFTQAQIAEELKLEIETISRMENGRISLSLDRVEQFAKILKCSPIDLLRPNSSTDNDIFNIIADAITSLTKDEQSFILEVIRNISSFIKKGKRKKSKQYNKL